jgi:hypothetical protein
MSKANPTMLRKAARAAIERKGAHAQSIIGRGRPENTYFKLTGAYVGDCAVRTAKFGWFAFPWMQDHWGTLRDCDYVLVATADDEDRPSAIDVHFFDAKTLTSAFDKARESKLSAGLKVSDWTGLWIALHDDPDAPQRSGAAKLASWSLRIDLSDQPEPVAESANAGPSEPPAGLNLTIADAKKALAAHYGVDPSAIEIVIRG